MQARINWSFAEACDVSTSVEDVQTAFMREIRGLGFSFAACASHVDPLRPPQGAVMMVDYPRPWLERFSAKRYAHRDPVYHTAKKQALPFQWSDLRFRSSLEPDQLRILDEAASLGLRDGFTIPIHSPGALPASCSLAIGNDGVDPLKVRQAHWYAVYAHESARRILLATTPPERALLSKRERECLMLIAQGKDDYAVSVLLGISEHTAHNTIRRAMKKYSVSTRMQAFVRALRGGEIRLEDVAD